MPAPTILNSWKEIASYVGRGVRTIQRYEAQLGFPVHRPAGKSRTSVIAFTDEIDTWLKSTPTHWQHMTELDTSFQAKLNSSPAASAASNHGGDTCPMCGGSGKISASSVQPDGSEGSKKKFANGGSAGDSHIGSTKGSGSR